MIIKRIPGATRVLGRAQGFLGLPVKDEVWDGNHVMTTAWEPTPDELAALNEGAPVLLHILGTGHPPVLITVGERPE